MNNILTPELKQRLEEIYPSGSLYEPNEQLLEENGNRSQRLYDAVRSINNACDVYCSNDGTHRVQRDNISITQREFMTISEWVNLSNQAKISWIKENNQPFPVLWIKVSRVLNYFEYYYNHWIPRADTGYLDVEIQQPNIIWQEREKEIFSILNQYDFKLFPEDLYNSTITYVQYQNFYAIPDDDLRWDDDDFEPPYEPAYIHECVFGEP